VINLPDDDPKAIDLLLRFLYAGGTNCNYPEIYEVSDISLNDLKENAEIVKVRSQRAGEPSSSEHDGCLG
jgi:hypothetical protein